MLNDELEKLKSATVRVEEGSGVLINPYSTQYSYILTAKHVVEDISVDKIEVKNIEGRNISVLDKVEHPVIDVAILKVERLDGVEISHIENFYNQEKKLKFYGYPKNKRHNHIFREQLYSYDCLLHDIQGNTSVFTINELTQYEDIEGFSGGGIFFINEENQDVSLVAIEFEVSNTQAADSKINCIRIDAYLDFLQDKGWDEIKPIHLSSFKFYRDNIFENLDLENEDSLDVVKNLLKITLNNYKIFNSYYVTPNKIVEEFANRILAHNQDLKKLYDKELWCAFLEFFAIYLSIFAPDDEDSCNSNYLERLFLNFRFIYDHNNIKFRQIFKTYILETEIGDLEPNGKIVIFTKNNLNFGCPYIDKNVSEKTLTDIGSAITGERIERVMRNKTISNEILFWPSVNDACLSCKEEELSRINIFQGDDLKELIVENYREYLSNEQ